MNSLHDRCNRIFQRAPKTSLQRISKHLQNLHGATTRAIWHAQSAERVARAISKFAPCRNGSDPTCTKVTRRCSIFTKHREHHEKRTLKISKHSDLSNFFVGVCKVLCLPGKPEARNLKINDDNFTVRQSTSKSRPSSPNTPRANVLATCRNATPATRMKKCPMSCTCHAEQRFRPQNVPDVWRLPHKMDTAQKTSTARW